MVIMVEYLKVKVVFKTEVIKGEDRHRLNFRHPSAPCACPSVPPSTNLFPDHNFELISCIETMCMYHTLLSESPFDLEV